MNYVYATVAWNCHNRRHDNVNENTFGEYYTVSRENNNYWSLPEHASQTLPNSEEFSKQFLLLISFYTPCVF